MEREKLQEQLLRQIEDKDKTTHGNDWGNNLKARTEVSIYSCQEQVMRTN